MQWFENLIARLMIMPYQKGWVQFPGNDPNKTYSEFYSNSSTEMIKLGKSFRDYPYFSIGSMMLAHYMVFAVIALTGMTVERSLATFWINDYEKKSRHSVPLFILLGLETFSVVVAYTAINILVDIYVWLGIGVALLITNFALYGYIWYWNIRVHRILDTTVLIPSKYTLQARFQAKENARSIDFTKFTVATCSMALISECIIFFLTASDFLEGYEVVLYYLVDLCNASHPVVIINLAMLAVPKWRKKFYCVRNSGESCWKRSNKTTMIVDVLKGPSTIQNETDTYFSQLNKSWS